MTLIGVFLAFGAVMTALLMEGSSPMSIILLPALILVFGGTFGATFAGLTTGDLKKVGGWFKLAVVPQKAADVSALIAILVKLAEKARKEGLLSLESEAKKIDDLFLQRGLQMAIDGTDPDDLREILEAEIDAKKAEYKVAARFFSDMGGYSPTIGIIGTVVGLIHVLENLSNPAELGHLIAGAFVATLWGVMSANVMWLPMARKIGRTSELDSRAMQLLVEGISEILAGTTPRNVRQKLSSLAGPGFGEQEAA
ncbi:motility protein A [Tessaracoccus sp.]